MWAGYLIIEAVLFVNPEVISFPFAGVKFQRLIGKLGNVFDVEGTALSLQALHVFFVHGLEAPKSFRDSVGRKGLHLRGMYEWLHMELIKLLVGLSCHEIFSFIFPDRRLFHMITPLPKFSSSQYSRYG